MGERIRRVTTPQLFPTLDIEVSEAAESIVGLAMAIGTEIRCENYDIGCSWFDEVRTRRSAELRDLMARFEGSEPIHPLWHTLLAAVAEAPACMPGFVQHVEAMPADDLWLQALGYYDHHAPTPELREAVLAAGRGAMEPLQRLIDRDPAHGGRWIHGLALALDGDAELAKGRIVALLTRWHDEVFSAQWAEIAPLLERDAAEKRRLARQRPPADVVEEATNGGEYVPEAGIGRLLLIPTYLGRPWVIHTRQGGTLVIVHPVGDAALAGSPEEAQRRRVQRLAKALSDDTRLRALRVLGTSSRSLQELADELGVRKSTMHHHLAVLRSAGLLRLRFSEKRYSLRATPLAELSGLLGDYLGGGERR